MVAQWRQSWGVGGRDPQILVWVRVRVMEGKEWEWEGKTPRFRKQIDATVVAPRHQYTETFPI
jgi:hypothetical protein